MRRVNGRVHGSTFWEIILPLLSAYCFFIFYVCTCSASYQPKISGLTVWPWMKVLCNTAFALSRIPYYEHVVFIFMKITPLYLQLLNSSPKQLKQMFPQGQTEQCTISTKRYISLYGHLLNLNQFNPNKTRLFDGGSF